MSLTMHADCYCPVPGIYPGVPFDDYLQWEAISNSSLQHGLKSMKHYRTQRPVEETPAMVRGTLVHTLFFEPLRFANEYTVMPRYEDKIRKPNGEEYRYPKSSAGYKELKQQFEEDNPGKTVVEQSDYDEAAEMCRSIRTNEHAAKCFDPSKVQFEVAIVWVDPETSLLCKGRVDALRLDGAVASDLKTTTNVDEFETTIAKRSYHRQGAFYADGLRELTREFFDFTLTAVESARPYDVRSSVLGEDSISDGRRQYRKILRQIAECRVSGIWPGYQSPKEWNIPAWAMSKEPVQLTVGGRPVKV